MHLTPRYRVKKMTIHMNLDEDSYDIVVPKQRLSYKGIVLDGHNDHRIVMAMSVILSKIGGAINGADAIKKSYPGFFKDIRGLGAEVILT